MNYGLKTGLILLRRGHLAVSMEIAIWTRPWSKKIWIFNLDLHTSLIQDLKIGLNDFDVKLVSWSVSGNNRNFRKFYKIPDPVQGISGISWLTLGPENFSFFQKRYDRFLRTFDAYIVCFPPSFAQIFTSYEKPILVYCGTRYEAPFTKTPSAWDELNKTIVSGSKSNLITVVANNLGDLDYLKYFTGVTPRYLPSLCDYTSVQWQVEKNKKIVFSRDSTISAQVSFQTQSKWQTPREAFGKSYNWKKLSQVEEILVIPYNISTMTLFELATAGIPVSVPSPRFLEELRLNYDGVLTELSFFEILKCETDGLESTNPNKVNSSSIRKWWTDRADFYNQDLMPNVRVIDSFNDLLLPHPYLASDPESMRSLIEDRNMRIYTQRRALLAGFISQIEHFYTRSNRLPLNSPNEKDV